MNNPISENIDITKGLTSGIEVLKMGKTSFHIDIENLNKVYYERDQINNGDKLGKKVQIPRKD